MLPMWGEQVKSDAINFEWPTREIFDRWPSNVSIKSITFSIRDKNYGSYISSVECAISTDEKSPLYDTTGQGQHVAKTIDFAAQRPVKTVEAMNDGCGISRVTFLDKNGAEIGCYNPKNKSRGGPMHEIADNEELIGVYGVRNKNP